MKIKSILIALLAIVSSIANAHAEVNITPDVVYGHKFGLANTLDVFTPGENAKGVGVLFMVSGGWYSNWAPPQQLVPMLAPLTDAGYTVFAVRHGSSPRFSIPEAVEDVRRSVRFIRSESQRFGIDPDRLGVFGMSAGGHLSLMLGTTGDEGNTKSQEPIERASNRVQAVVAWVAPTDLTIMIHTSPDSLPAYQRFPALNLAEQLARAHSPLMHVSGDDAPTLLLAGAADDLVPIDHSRRLQKKFDEFGVRNRLIEFPNAGHGLAGDDLKQAIQAMVQWFDQHLDSNHSKD